MNTSNVETSMEVERMVEDGGALPGIVEAMDIIDDAKHKAIGLRDLLDVLSVYVSISSCLNTDELYVLSEVAGGIAAQCKEAERIIDAVPR